MSASRWPPSVRAAPRAPHCRPPPQMRARPFLLVALFLPAIGAALIPGGELPSDRKRLLKEVKIRSNSPARTAFESVARSSDPSAFELACLIAAEETYPDVTHEEMRADLARCAAEITSDASTRLRLRRLFEEKADTTSESQRLASALSATIFGPSEMADVDAGMFKVSTPSDPRGALLHEVVARRSGSAFTLSFIYMEAAALVGLPLQPLAAPGPPGHLLLVPRDEEEPSFAVDVFRRGRVFPLMPTLRRMYTQKPLTARDMTLRMLHSLRRGYGESMDAVRMIGTLDRLLVLYAIEEKSDSNDKNAAAREAERRKCTRQLVECILALRDVSRAAEAHQIIQSLLNDPSASAEARRLEPLLADPWLHEFAA
ncbi:hypothetical protein AB1Y20_003184 [Prymnesium parvum]|uniref:Protein SirB1 N-terminal domain-containing protein n=1 Tax=Prymnesium parvum TaxID=97485 RepID=A0AB34JDK6_PRYPA